MLYEKDAIKYEHVKYKTTSSHVYTFICTECGDHETKVERKLLKSATGRCRFCAHKGIPFKSSYNHLKDGVERTNAKRKKQKEFNLTFEEFMEFVQTKECHYCNKTIKWVKHAGTGRYRYNLDRKDSNSGYSKSNCVVCCKECNLMKNAWFSYEEFLEIIKLVDKMRDGNLIVPLLVAQL